MAKESNPKNKNTRKLKTPIKMEIAEPKIIQKPLTNGQYQTQPVDKKMVFLHHTSGFTAESAISWWNQTPERIGVAYVIDRDGKIYQCFDDKYWASHLGIHGTIACDKFSVGIEIVSAGGLTKESDGNYYFYPFYPKDTKKHLINPEEVIEFEWRGFKAFQKYTDLQLQSLGSLIKFLVKKYNIQIPKIENWYDFNQEVINKVLPGIWSHTTVRKDKSDIVPYPQFISWFNTLLNSL